MAPLTKREKRAIASSPALVALYSQLFDNRKGTINANSRRIDLENSLQGGIKSGSNKPSSGGGGFSSLKALGSNTLNALTVPGAVAVTSLTNAMQALKGDPLVSWKNLGGTFRGDKYAGGTALLKSFGVTNPDVLRWGGLATDVLVDPTWALAVVPGAGEVAVGAKIAGVGKRAEALRAFVQEGTRHANTIAEAGRDTERITKDLAEFAKTASPAELTTLGPRALEQVTGPLGRRAQARAELMAMGRMPHLRIRMPFKRTGGVLVPLTGKVRGAKDVAKMMERVVDSPFRMAPANKVAQELRRTVRGLEELDAAIMEDFAQRFQPLERILIYQGANVAEHSQTKWSHLRAQWQDRGWWSPEMDEALSALQERGKIQAKQAGVVPWDEQGNMARQLLEEHVGPVHDLAGRGHAGIAKLATMGFADAAQRVDKMWDEGTKAIEQVTAKAADDVARAQRDVQQVERELGQINQRMFELDQQIARHDPAKAPRKPRARKGEVKGQPGPKAVARARRAELLAQRKQLELNRRNWRRVLRQTQERLDGYVAAAPKAEAKAWQRLADRRAAMMDDLVSAVTTTVKAAEGSLEGRVAAMTDRAMGEVSQKAAAQGLTEFSSRMKQTLALNKKGELVWRKPSKRGRGKFDVESFMAKAGLISDRGPYIPGTPSRFTTEDVRRHMTERRLTGKVRERPEGVRDVSEVDHEKLRNVENPVRVLTHERLVDSLANEYKIDETVAKQIADDMDSHLGLAAKDTMWPGIDEIVFRPELDPFTAGTARHRGEAVAAMERQMERMANSVVKSLYGDKSKDAQKKMVADIVRDLQAVTKTGRSDSSLARVLGVIKRNPNHEAYGATRFQYYTAWLKAWFTVMNPGHYVANAVGQFMANLITLGPLQAARGLEGAIPGSKTRHLAYLGTKHGPSGELAQGVDREFLNRTFKIGKNEMSGWEIALGARLSGLGMGFTQTDVQAFLNLAKGSGTKRVRNAMQMFNMRREDAMRINTWLEHVRRGDDFFTAGARTIRTHFDYDALTDVERVWMRNLMLFYTWFKNNMVLQGYGVLARPALYSTLQHYEHSRPKFANEPDWWRTAGGVYTPLGILTWGNPMAELNRINLDPDNVRQMTLGGGNPFFRMPVEVLMNRNNFTGGEVYKFQGQNVPHWLPAMADALGVPGIPMSRGRADDASPSPAMDAGLAHLLSGFTGPQGGLMQQALGPDQEGNTLLGILSKLSGLRLQQNQPQKFERSAKAKRTKQKGDATRKRSYERA